jgi:DNA recombination protein RmuC
MTTIIYLVVGIGIGGLLIWFFAKSRSQGKITELEKRVSAAESLVADRTSRLDRKDTELDQMRNELAEDRRAKVEALTRLEEAKKSFEEQKTLIDAMKTEMTDTFNALSKAALDSSNESFLTLASERLGKVVEETKGKLGEHQSAMDGMIKPLSDALKKYEEEIRLIEESRHKAYGSLTEQLRSVALTQENLQRETSNLVSALRKPQVRGRWGEMQLRRVAELSGMSMHCDFTEQHSVDTDKGRIRPDMIVHLPAEREIVVDSKVSLEAYLDAAAAVTEEEKKAKMEKHAQQVRAHMNKLGSKEYWSQFRLSPEFVILFIPGESFLSAAVEVDAALIEDGMQKRVIIATPTTFIALLRAIAYGWRQEQLTRNAQEVGMLGKELYERMNVMARYFQDLGSAIDKAIVAYNKAVGSMEARVLPSLRKFRELGVSGAEEVPVLEQIDQNTRSLSHITGDE